MTDRRPRDLEHHCIFLLSKEWQPVVANICNPSTWMLEVRRLSQVQGQPALQGEILFQKTKANNTNKPSDNNERLASTKITSLGGMRRDWLFPSQAHIPFHGWFW